MLPKSLKNSFDALEKETEKSGKHKKLIDFTETLLIYLSHYIIGYYRRQNIESVEYEKLFYKNSKNLSTGTYIMFLREALKILNKENCKPLIYDVLCGKNEVLEVSKFIVAFETIKDAINKNESENLLTKANNAVASKTNYAKINGLEFFNTFIQLRNRVAHPHKEINELMVHWPSSEDYYDCVNIYLHEALSTFMNQLTPLWEHQLGVIMVEEGEAYIENQETGDVLEIDSKEVSEEGNEVLYKDNEWVCITPKNIMRVSDKALQSIEDEKQQALHLENIEQFKDNIVSALDDGQISADELRFFNALGASKFNIDAHKIKDLIFEVAKSLNIEEPFPEVDQRLVKAIDDALISGQYNAFFLKLMAKNYGVDEEGYDKLLNERAVVNNVDLSTLEDNVQFNLNKKEFIDIANLIKAQSWIEGLGSITGVKGLYAVEGGNHNTIGSKEYIHRKAFSDSLDYVKNTVGAIQKKVGIESNWKFEVNKWQAGKMSGYVWVQFYPEGNVLSNELALFILMINYGVYIGLMPHYDKIEDLSKTNYGLVLNLVIDKLKKYTKEFEQDFNRFNDLTLDIFGTKVSSEKTVLYMPLKDVIKDMPNYFDHFYRLNRINFISNYRDLEVDPLKVGQNLEVVYTLLGNVIEEVNYDYNLMVDTYVDPLSGQLDQLKAIVLDWSSTLSKYTVLESELTDNPRAGKITCCISKKIKGVLLSLEFGFWNNLKGEIYFGFQVKTINPNNEIDLIKCIEVIDLFSTKVEILPDSCVAGGMFSSRLKVSDEEGQLIESSILNCKSIFEKYLSGLIESVATIGYPGFLELIPIDTRLDTLKINLNQILDEVKNKGITSNKIQEIRSLLCQNTYTDLFGSSKKFGWHAIEYGFDFKEKDIRLLIAVNISDNISAAPLIEQLSSLEGIGFLKEEVIEETEGLRWFVKDCEDAQILSSTNFNKNHSAKLSRLNMEPKFANWSPIVDDESQWIGVDFGAPQKVHQVAIQGRFNKEEWVASFKISWSLNGKSWVDEDAVFKGNVDNNAVNIQMVDKEIIARFIRIKPVSWHGRISMRFDVQVSDVKSKGVRFIKFVNLDQESLTNMNVLVPKILENIECVKSISPTAFGF